MVNDLIVHLVFVDMFGLFSLIVNSYVDVWKEEEKQQQQRMKRKDIVSFVYIDTYIR